MKEIFSKKIVNWILPIGFGGVILVISVLNFKVFYHHVKDGTIDREAIEGTYKSEFYAKDMFSDLYGISLNILNKNIVGNFEYMKDNSGFMHSIAATCCSKEAVEQFLEDMITLRDDLEQQEIPIVYVQIPSRELVGYSDYPSEIFSQTAEVTEYLINELSDAAIDVLNIGEYCLNNKGSMDKDQFFFRTDIHLTTDAEMWVGKYLADYLNENTTCEIDKGIFDVSQYRKESYSFKGNLVKECGRYFTKDDTFDMYYPAYNTSMVLDNRLHGVEKNGKFEEVIMNEGADAYKVIKYLQFTSPYYKITNNQQEKNNILMIIDSMCFRIVSYLSLGCHNVTILDPRFFGGIDFIEIALKNENYDAVIVCHQSSLFGHDFFPERTGKDSLSLTESIDAVSMCSLDFCNGTWTENKNILKVDTSKTYIELSGWAADLESYFAAKDTYIAIGSHILKCEYGAESQSLEDFFDNPNFHNAGFSIKIPMDLVVAENMDSFQIWVVSSDGTKVYKSPDYLLLFDDTIDER